MVHSQAQRRTARAQALRPTSPAGALSYLAFALAVGFAGAVVFGLIS